ncbi:MAG: spermidine/putrescine ABC transporter substrate-binding protein [Candidatus Cloacimonadaceae bacterium]|nr:spermidine/putrescine ABC transporter substrate-binding protein [Candidatus Cloacimonadaceae bacterium]MDP3114294.1 spermidine/putrescine ABC transporter substrate-binding protein [Candidatus Cloacimonadaceae bacterium]
MKTFLLLLAAIILILAAISCAKRTNTLHIFNWAEYVDPELIAEFEKENECKIQYSTYNSNENMFTKIKSSRQSLDIVFPSGDHVSILAAAGLLEILDMSLLTNYSNLDPVILDKAKSHDPENNYSIPYFWGLTGLMYNKQHVPEKLVETNTWAILGDKFFENKKKVTMLEDAREVVGAALNFSGFDMNDTSADALRAAAKVLDLWDNNITRYVSESYKIEVPDGTTWLAQAFNGDALQLMEMNSDLGFILPKEGCSLWMDSMVILKSSKNKELAHKFINFMMNPENAKRNAEYSQYATPNRSAYQLLEEEIKNNKLIYPDPVYLEKCTMIEAIGERVRNINAIFEKISLNKRNLP